MGSEMCIRDRGEREAALSCLEKAVAVLPANVEVLLKAAAELLNREDGQNALRFVERALSLAPNNPHILEAKAIAFAYSGDICEAAAWVERALQLAPTLATANNIRATFYYKIGDAASAFSYYSTALANQPGEDYIWSNRLLMLNYLGISPQQQLAEHRQWGDFFVRKYRDCRPKWQNEMDGDRRLRIGYVSADFCQHSVAYFIAPILLAHDRACYEIYCYSNVRKPDKFTERIKAFDVVWRDISAINDIAAASIIADDRIDILVDLGGHTSHNRLPVFALHPAPIQMTYLGYPTTTGLSTIAYRLTDSLADPPGMTEHLYSEHLLRLDPCFLCYNPLSDAPPVAPTPVAKHGAITFGSFNNLAKVSDPCIAMWADILHAVPEATLTIKTEALNHATARDNMLQRFAKREIDPGRLRLIGHIPNALQHLAAYNEIDIALDTWPYHGTTTTCEAMWMGVPVVTLAGNIHVSRVGVSLLTVVGLPELIAKNPEEYVSIAVSLAADKERLTHLRQGMRQRMIESPLLDMKSMARRVEDVYRSCWRDYCNNARSA